MRKDIKDKIKRYINQAKVVSFDVFDTLIFRKVNEPEAVFDLVGQHFGIMDFRKIRMDAQDEASKLVIEKYGFPHADIFEIYEELNNSNIRFGIDGVESSEGICIESN